MTDHPTDPTNAQPDDQLDTRKLTWAVLLGRWVDFARSALALPDHQQGRALKASVPDLVMLQAVWFALQHLGDLPTDERALGIDRAQVLIERHAEALEQRFADQPMPEQIRELIDDAWAQLHRVQ
jgi:hypothetical protein